MRRTSVVRGGGDMLVGSFDRFLAVTRALTDRKGEAQVLKSHANMLVQDRIITYPPLLKLAAMIGYSIYAAYC